MDINNNCVKTNKRQLSSYIRYYIRYYPLILDIIM